MALPSSSSSAIRGVLRQDCLHVDALPHWLFSPWFPEHWDDLVLPLEFGSRVIYLSTSGLVLFLPQEETGEVLVEGRTGEKSSSFRIERDASQYVIQGEYEGDTVNVHVSLAPGSLTVKGPTGYFRSDYEIFWDGQGWSVAGTTGEFESAFRLNVEGDERIHVEGQRRGQAIDQHIYWEQGSIHFKDADSHFWLRPDGDAVVLQGTMRGEETEVHFMRAGDELRVLGMTGLGKVNYQVVQEGRGLQVKGRVHKWFVNYKVELL